MDRVSLKNGIKALHDELYANAANLTPAQASDRYADQMSILIDTFVKTGKPQVPGTGLTAGGNPVTGTSTTGSII